MQLVLHHRSQFKHNRQYAHLALTRNLTMEPMRVGAVYIEVSRNVMRGNRAKRASADISPDARTSSPTCRNYAPAGGPVNFLTLSWGAATLVN
jgi:hypothetical protein